MSNWNIRCNILFYENSDWIAFLVQEINTTFFSEIDYNFFCNGIVGSFSRNRCYGFKELLEGDFIIVWGWTPSDTSLPDEKKIERFINPFTKGYSPYINLSPYIIPVHFIVDSPMDDRIRAKKLLELWPDLSENYISYI